MLESIKASTEDKQVLIDHLEEEDEDSSLQQPSSSSCPEIELCVDNLKLHIGKEPEDANTHEENVSDHPQTPNSQQPPKPKSCCFKSPSLRFGRFLRHLRETASFHKRLLASSGLLIPSSAGVLIFFPLHLERVSSGRGAGREGIRTLGDGYSACLTASTVTTLMFLFHCILLEIWEKRMGVRRAGFTSVITDGGSSVLAPLIGWRDGLKVGFCFGLSFVTIFYSWESDKVPCNFQDPLLGLVVIFAILTHAVYKWNNVGLRRTFCLAVVAAGVFLSVDYPLVDHHRCRGTYYREDEAPKASRQIESEFEFVDMIHRSLMMNGMGWSWKVHLVWTMAFVVSIWLATVAAFFLESCVPVPKVKHNRLYDLEYNAVKLRVIESSNNNSRRRPSNNGPDPDEPSREESRATVEVSSSLKSRYRFSPYSHFHFNLIANSVLWFSVATWTIIVSLFWTEFIPGFGKGLSGIDRLPDRLMAAFTLSLCSFPSWALFISLFVFSQAFTYVTVLTKSPMTSIALSSVGFPIIGLWWSFFQMKYSFFVWMPVFSGELVCASLGLLCVLGGAFYFIQFEILRPALVLRSNSVRKRLTVT